MEDILSSIRRIIADDQKTANEREAASASQAETAPETSIEADIAALRSALDAIRGEVGSLRDEGYAAQDMQEDEGIDVSVEEEALVSRDVETSVRQSFAELAGAISSHKERGFEEMAREMLRPMLKSWLDENLPPLVERLVREEIKRLVNLQD